MKRKETSDDTDLGNERTNRLEKLIAKWNAVYDTTNKNKNLLEEQIEGRESRQKILSECVVTLNRAHELSRKDFEQCLEEVESMKLALTELESCERTLKSLQAETNSNENELVLPGNDQQEIVANINQCKEIKIVLSKKLERIQAILKLESQFNTDIAKLTEWIASTERVLVKDFYSLTEEQRQAAASEQERLAKEFSARKETVEKLVKVGKKLKFARYEEYGEEISKKLTELSEKWKGVEEIFTSQEEHVEECLREHQNYYDAVEQLWDWIQGIGKRMNVQMETSEPNSEHELVEYLSMLKEIRERSLLCEKVLKSGETLSARLDEGEAGEIQEQLERLTSEWEMLKSQVVERLKELREIMGERALLAFVESQEASLEELKCFGILEENNDVGSGGISFARNMGLSFEPVVEDSAQSLGENNLEVKKESTQEAELPTGASAELLPKETLLSRDSNDFSSFNSDETGNLAKETELYGALSTRQSAEETELKNAEQIFVSSIEQKESSQDFSVPSSIPGSPEININESNYHCSNKLQSDEAAVHTFDGGNKYQEIPDQNLAQRSTSVDSNGNIIDIPNERSRVDEEMQPDSFVQILVLPVKDSGNTIDFTQETSRTGEKYPSNSIQIPSNSETIESSTKPLDAESIENGCYCEFSAQGSTISTMDTFDQHLAAENLENHGCSKVSTENTADCITQIANEMDESNGSSAKCFNIQDTEEMKSTSNQFVLFMNRMKDSEEFLDFIETRIDQFNEKESSEFLTEFINRDPDFESVLETGMNLIRDIPEDEQFAVEEKIVVVEEKWITLKEKLIKRKAAAETASLLKNRLQQCEEFVEEISDFVSSKEANPEWLFTEEETGSIIECYLGRLEREQIALKGHVEGTKDTLAAVPGKTGEEIEEKLWLVSTKQTQLARQLFEKKSMLERWFDFSLILEGVEHEVEALTEECKDLVDGKETGFILESHLSESRVHMLKILLGSLKGKASTLSELSTEYKDVLSFSNDCSRKFKTHEQNISAKVALVSDRLKKLENHLESFKKLENETNELQVEVEQADEALSTFGEGLTQFDEVDSKGGRFEQLSEIIHLEERILKLEPRVKLVKEKSLEQLDKLDYESSGYWFQENVQCLVSRYESARTRARKNLESTEFRVSLKDEFQVKLLDITSFLVNVEEYLNEDEEIPRNFDVTAKEVALLNGRRFLEEMESKEGGLCDLMEVSEKLSKVERSDTWRDEALQLRERFNIRLKELRQNVSCLDETLKCFNEFEQKVEELSSLMLDAHGFLYGEGVETRGLEDLLELGRSCLKNVEQKQVTLWELKKRVERLTESFSDGDKDVIISELLDLEMKLSALKMRVVERISSLETLGSRHDVYKAEVDKVRNGISSLKEKMNRNDSFSETGDKGALSGLRKDKQTEDCSSQPSSDESWSEKLTDESFSQKLEEFRTRLQNLNRMKLDLEEESQETKVDLGTLLGLEPLELTFADLEKIDEEKANELREYTEKEQVILAKVSEFEDKFKQLQFQENKAHPALVSKTAAKTDGLLQEVESTLMDVDSLQKLADTRKKVVNRLETIQNECVEIQRRLVKVEKNAKQDRNDTAAFKPVDGSVTLVNAYQPIPQSSNPENGATTNEIALPSSGTSQQNNSATTLLPEDACAKQGNADTEIILPCNVPQRTFSISGDPVFGGGIPEGHLGFSEIGNVQAKELAASDLDGRTFECLSEGKTNESKSIIVNDFETLQRTIDELANDEEVLEMMISNSEYTSENFCQELKASKEKLELIQQKETFLHDITSKAVDILEAVSAEEQEKYQDSIEEIEEKFRTANECLLTRIEMLEQCVQTSEKLKENIVECYKILESVEDIQNDDLEMVNECIKILRDPNSCLENANRLNFALSVVGGFEEAESTKQEIDDLEERWGKALEYLEQQVKEGYVSELTQESIDVSSRDEVTREDFTHEDVTEPTEEAIQGDVRQCEVKCNTVVQMNGTMPVKESREEMTQKETSTKTSLEETPQSNITKEYLKQQVKEGHVAGTSKENVPSIQSGCAEQESEMDSEQSLVQQKGKPVSELESSHAENTSPVSDDKKLSNVIATEGTSDTNFVKESGKQKSDDVSDFQEDSDIDAVFENMAESFTVNQSKGDLVDSGNDIAIEQEKVVEMDDANRDTLSLLNKYKDGGFQEGGNYRGFEVDGTEHQMESEYKGNVVDQEEKNGAYFETDVVVQQRLGSENENVSSTFVRFKHSHHEPGCKRDADLKSEDTTKQLKVKDVESLREKISSLLTGHKDNRTELESENCAVEDVAEAAQEAIGMELANLDTSLMLNQPKDGPVVKRYELKDHIEEDGEDKCQNKDNSNVNDGNEQYVENGVDTQNIADDAEPIASVEGEGFPREMNREVLSDVCVNLSERTMDFPEISKDDHMAGEISQEDLSAQSLEEEQRNAVEESIAEMNSVDFYKKQDAPSKNVLYPLEECVVKEISQRVVGKKSWTHLEDESAVESMEDKLATGVHENQTTSTVNIPISVDKNPVKDVTPNDVVVTNVALPIGEQRNVITKSDASIAPKRQATLLNQIPVTSEECTVKDAPRKDVVVRDSALPREQQEDNEETNVKTDHEVRVEVTAKDLNGNEWHWAKNWEVGRGVCLERSEISTVNSPEKLIGSNTLQKNAMDRISRGKSSTIDGNDVSLSDEIYNVSEEIKKEEDGPFKMSQQGFVTRDRPLIEEQESCVEETDKTSEANDNSEKDIVGEISQDNVDASCKTRSEKENIAKEACVIAETSDFEDNGINSLDDTVEDPTIDTPGKCIDNPTHQQNVMDPRASKDRGSNIPESNVTSANEISDTSQEVNSESDEPSSQEGVATSNRTLSEEKQSGVYENFVEQGTSGKTKEATLLDNISGNVEEDIVDEDFVAGGVSGNTSETASLNNINGNSEWEVVSELTQGSTDVNSGDEVTREGFTHEDVTETAEEEAIQGDVGQSEVKYNTVVQMNDTMSAKESWEEMTQKETSAKTNLEKTPQHIIMSEKLLAGGITQAEFYPGNIIPTEIIRSRADQDSPTEEESSQDKVISEEADKSDKTEKNEFNEEQVFLQRVSFGEDNRNGVKHLRKFVQANNDQSEIYEADEAVHDINYDHEGEILENPLHKTSDTSQVGTSDKMPQNNEVNVQGECNSEKTHWNKDQEIVDFNFIDSAAPSFCVATVEDTYKESNTWKLEDAYCTVNAVSTELAKIKNIIHRQAVAPEMLLEYEMRSLRKLRSIEMQLQNVTSENINLDTVEKDKKKLLSNLVKEQQLEIVRARDVLNNRVRKIERFFATKTRMKDRIETISLMLEETSKEFSLKDRVEKMEQLLHMDEGLSENFANCLESLSNEYPSLDLSYAEQIHEHYKMKKSEVIALLNATKKQLKVKLDIEEELNNCAEWLEEKMIEVNEDNADVSSLQKAVDNVDEFLVGLEDRVQRLRSYSIPEKEVLNILPMQERTELLSQVKELEERLKKTQAFVKETKNDLKVKVGIARRNEKISACQLWCKKTEELLYGTSKSSQSLFDELSDLINEGETIVKTVQQSLSGEERCDVVELAKELLQAGKEKLQGISKKEETLEELSCELSDIERRILQFEGQGGSTENEESLKFQEDIENAQNRLQNISNEIKSVFPDLERYPANSRESELLRKSEYLLKEINELSEKRLSREILADCENSLEQVKNVCSKPLMFCLDVVKMKKELAELGKVSLELKDKEARLQQVK